MKTKNKIGLLLLFAVVSLTANAQTMESHIRHGNSSYKKGDYANAVELYKRSLDTKYNDKAQFNLGDAYYQQKNFEEAARSFQSVTDRNVSKQMEADSYYNLGNTMMEQQKYKEAFDAYKNCIKLNPNDEDARYNLEYARQKMIVQQQQQQQQNQDQNKDQDKQDQQQNQDQQQQQNQDQQNQDKQEQEQQQQQQQQQQEQQMSKEDAERMLQALEEQEKNTMDKMNEAKAAQMKRRKIQKDW